MTTHIADDGTVRQNHYGEGEQPWDVIQRLGWAPEFAAGNVLKYLRRTKDPEHSLESALWYYARLLEMSRVPTDQAALARLTLRALFTVLTEAERERLTAK